MREPGDEADLPEEPLRSHRGGDVGMDHLEGDGAIVPEVVRQVHGRGPAPAEEGEGPVGSPLDPVSVRQGRRKAFVYGYHACAL